MVNVQHVLTIFSLLPLGLSIVVLSELEAAKLGRGVRNVHSALGEGSERHRSDGRWLPKSVTSRKKRSVRSTPQLRTTRMELEIRRTSTPISLAKRQLPDVNGSIIELGTSLNTYVLPVSLGTPPVVYPLQLDLGSSDLLLASTLCGDSCPESKGPSTNPYYDVSVQSSSFTPINANHTAWASRYADGTAASGFVARETVTIGNASLSGQIFGMINSTNLTLSAQSISGLFGLGFPRLSILSRAIYQDNTTASGTPSTSAGPASSSSAPLPYYPPVLESLTKERHVPYPVFGLALAPPPSKSGSSFPSRSSDPNPEPTSSDRFQSEIGSLTIGGISSLYVDQEAGSGRTLTDIEWHDVVPFGRAYSEDRNTTGISRSPEGFANGTTILSSSTDASAIQSSTLSTLSASATAPARKRQASTGTTMVSDSYPSSLMELAGEEYLYWAIQLQNVTVNGTDIGLESSYRQIGIPPIALLDVGFNGISGPAAEVAKIFANVPQARQIYIGQWAAPCDTKMALGFSFGGRYVQLQPSEWMYAKVGMSSFCLAWPLATAPTGDGIDWQLGTPFLKQVYSVYSYGIDGEQAPMVGFLPLDHDIPSVANSSATSSTSSSTQTITFGPTPTTIEAFTATTTAHTEMPNVVLAVPTYSLPSYVYGLDPQRTPGAIQTIGLANSSVYDVGEVPIVNAEYAYSQNASQGDTPEIGGGNTQGSGDQGDAGLQRSLSCGLLVMAMMASVMWTM